METINTIATAASKAIWGENKAENQSGQEPVSGKMGNVAAGEPYDAGNIEPSEAALSSAERKETERKEEVTETAHETAKDEPKPETAEAKPEPEAKAKPDAETKAEEAAHKAETELERKPEAEAKPKSEIKPKAETAETEPRAETKGEAETKPEAETKHEPEPQMKLPLREDKPTATSSAGPAKEAPSAAAMREDSTKAQNDTRAPPPAPAPAPAQKKEKEREKQEQEPKPGAATLLTGPTIKEQEEAQAPPASTSPASAPGGRGAEAAKEGTEEAPVNIEGPGPRPVEEVAKERGGDAGAVRSDTGAGGEESSGQPRRDSAKDLGGEAEGKGKDKDTAAGAGEQYVRSSGLAAEGGDFDASKPGAGREAERLMEEKGLHRGHEPHAGGKHEHEGGKEKTSLKEKIKAKLHKPTHLS
ncbi:hypothetical protein VTK56DRAFT_4036 [Thermocarpiscus australiensis]